jgi:RNA polymerase sigma-70 factor (ECF subfamily)
LPAVTPPLAALDDDALVPLISDGSDEAFRVAFERYQPRLHAYCRSILRDADEAHDAVQSTMLRALFGLRGDDRQIRLQPWLYRAAHNECISRLRKRRPEVELEAAPEPATESIEHQAERTEEVRHLVADLKLLSPRQQRVLVLREFAGLRYRDIAAVDDTTPGSAREAAREARDALGDYAAGRGLTCDEVAMELDDGRSASSRVVQGHLRACRRCADEAGRSRWRVLVPGWLAALLPRALGDVAARPVEVAAGLTGAAGVTASASLLGKAATVAGTVLAGATVTPALPALKDAHVARAAPAPKVTAAAPKLPAARSAPAASTTTTTAALTAPRLRPRLPERTAGLTIMHATTPSPGMPAGGGVSVVSTHGAPRPGAPPPSTTIGGARRTTRAGVPGPPPPGSPPPALVRTGPPPPLPAPPTPVTDPAGTEQATTEQPPADQPATTQTSEAGTDPSSP